MQYGRLAAFFLLLLAAPATLDAGETIGLELVSSAVTPLYVTHAPGDRDHLFVAERAGRVRVLDLETNEFLAEPLLDLRGRVAALNSEGGLLGLTFHPDYQENGQFFAYVSENAFAGGFNHASYIRRYEVQDANPLAADLATEATVLRFNQPQGNHNAGWIDFSPADGYLYISSGDGGGGNDSGANHTSGIGNSQDITDNWLGKILRVDVNGDDFPDENRNYVVPPDNPFVDATGDDEIFAYGLRNPFRDGFDRANGDLYIGDVGQNFWEEIDFLPANSGGGQNYGWRLREGLVDTPTGGVGGPPPADNVDPIHVYPHGSGPNGGNSVTGGAVYRGPVAELQGKYIFADFLSNQIWSFHYDGTAVNDLENITAALRPPGTSIGGITAFGEDAVGNMYIAEIGGRIWRITGAAATGDFNRDALVDRADGQLLLANLGTLTDATAAMGDTDGDGDVDGNDLKALLLGFGTSALDVPAGSTAALASGVPSVPEPASATLAAILVAILLPVYLRLR